MDANNIILRQFSGEINHNKKSNLPKYCAGLAPLRSNPCFESFFIDYPGSNQILSSDTHRLIYDDFVVVLPSGQIPLDYVSDIAGEVVFGDEAFF